MKAAVPCLVLLAAAFSGCASPAERDAYRTFQHAQQGYPQARTEAQTRPAVELPAQPMLNDYLTFAALNNPALEAAFDRWKAALERIPQARALPDPQFTYHYFIVPQAMRDGDMRNVYEISQTFPWLRKLELRSDQSVEEARRQQQLFEVERLKLFNRVQQAYYDYYNLSRSLSVTRDNLQQLRFIEGISRARYRTSGGSAPDVLRAQVELGKAENDVQSLEDLRSAAAGKLNAALNLPPETPQPWPGKIAGQETIPPDAQLLEWMKESNPELKAMAADIAREAKAVELAQQDYFPDVMLGFEYDQMTPARGLMMSPEDPYAIMLSVNLPIWCEKYSAGVREAKAQRWAVARERMEKVNSLSADLKMAAYNFRNNQRKIALYRDALVPRALQSLKSVQAGYQTGAASFSDLIDAQRVLLELQLAYEQSLANRQQSLAELGMLVGRAVPAEAQAVQTQPFSGPAD